MLADNIAIDQEYWDADDQRAWTPLRAAFESDIKMSHTRTMCILTLLAAQADFEMMLQPDGWSLTGILRRLGPNMDRDTANVEPKHAETLLPIRKSLQWH